MGLIRIHYVGRTFIEPQQSIRHFGVRLKLSPVRAVLDGKRVVVVDDSIVRGTTSRKIVKMLRDAGAREVHLRISAPPTHVALLLRHRHADAQRARSPSSHSVEEIARYVTSDSLGYLSLEGMMAGGRRPDDRQGLLPRVLHRQVSGRARAGADLVSSAHAPGSIDRAPWRSKVPMCARCARS